MSRAPCSHAKIGQRSTVPARPPSARLRAGARQAAAALGLVALALATSACAVKQNSGNANLVYGKQQFVAKCGACHTLARANTKGIVGPNLDEAFRAAIEEAHGRTAIRGVVEYQVLFPNRKGVMPKELATGSTLHDIASYVAEAAARPGPDTGLLASAVAPPGAGKPALEKAGKLAIEANPQGQLAYTTSKAIATPGAVTISMTNMSGVGHNLAVQSGTSGPVLGATPIESKGTSSITVNLKAGTYTYFCQVPGHRAAGMLGTITVK